MDRTGGADHQPAGEARVTFGKAYRAGIQIGLVCGVGLGCIETAWTWYRVGSHYGPAPIPWELFGGAGGRYVVTHALFWTVLAAVYSLPVAWWLTRRARRGRDSVPETIHIPLMVMLGGCLLVPFALDLSSQLDAVSLPLLILASLVVAVVAHLLLRALMASRIGAWLRKALAWSVIPGLGLVAVGWVLMERSPLGGVHKYAVPRSTQAGTAARSGPPDVVWIVLDTVRAERMSCYGYSRPTTPYLERLAAECAVYDRAVSSGYWTVPSHGSMFTGLPVRAHGADHESRWLDDEHTTIAELLSEAGYQTAMLANNPYICMGHNFGQGFEVDPPFNLLGRLQVMSWFHWCEWLGIGPFLPWMETDTGAAMVNFEIARWLDTERDPSRPLFVYVNYMDAHMPYQAPRRIRRMFMSDEDVVNTYRLRRHEYGDILVTLLFEYNMLGADRVAGADLRAISALYDASIRYLDERVEELMDLLRRRGLLENGVVVITSDHGEELGERNQWGHEFGVHDTLVRVPLMIRFPGGEPRGRVDYPVQTLDLFTTTAALAKVERPYRPGLQSEDLTGVNPTFAAERMVVAESTSFDPRLIMWAKQADANFKPGPYLRQLRAGFVGPYKLIWSSDGELELYNVVDDPDESNNLVQSEPDVLDRLAGQLRNWVRSVPAYEFPSGKKKPHLDPQIIRQLRALGYFQ